MLYNKRILVIDDDSVSQFLCKKAIDELGAGNVVMQASNGQEALEILNDYCEGRIVMPEIILLDLHMPVMNGLDFLEQYNNMKCVEKDKITMMVVSASVDPDELSRARALGISYFLAKPVIKTEMREALLRELRMRSGEEGSCL